MLFWDRPVASFHDCDEQSKCLPPRRAVYNVDPPQGRMPPHEKGMIVCDERHIAGCRSRGTRVRASVTQVQPTFDACRPCRLAHRRWTRSRPTLTPLPFGCDAWVRVVLTENKIENPTQRWMVSRYAGLSDPGNLHVREFFATGRRVVI